MKKFEVGARVRLTVAGVKYMLDAEVLDASTKTTGTVRQIDDDYMPYLVRLDCSTPDNGQDEGWWCYPDWIESIDSSHPTPDPSTLNDNPTIKSVILEVIDAQMAKGATKYSQGVDVNDGHAWLVEAAQEVGDTFVYLAAEIVRLRQHVATLEARVNEKGGDDA